MTPYRYTRGDQQKENYNHKLSATRVRIENAFGILKGRFNQLRYLKFFNVKKISAFVKACCVLHNICIDLKDDWDMDDSDARSSNMNADVGSSSTAVAATSRQLKQKGEEKRNRIANDLWNV
jgi:DDE superfamily endonuclease